MPVDNKIIADLIKQDQDITKSISYAREQLKELKNPVLTKNTNNRIKLLEEVHTQYGKVINAAKTSPEVNEELKADFKKLHRQLSNIVHQTPVIVNPNVRIPPKLNPSQVVNIKSGEIAQTTAEALEKDLAKEGINVQVTPIKQQITTWRDGVPEPTEEKASSKSGKPAPKKAAPKKAKGRADIGHEDNGTHIVESEPSKEPAALKAALAQYLDSNHAPPAAPDQPMIAGTTGKSGPAPGKSGGRAA